MVLVELAACQNPEHIGLGRFQRIAGIVLWQIRRLSFSPYDDGCQRRQAKQHTSDQFQVYYVSALVTNVI